MQGNINSRYLIRALLALPPAALVLYLLWWTLVFFPDDYGATRREALKTGKSRASQIVDVSLLDRIDGAALTGDFSKERLGMLAAEMKEKGFLFKGEPFSASDRRFLLYRAGSGLPGIWMDERSALLLPAGCSVSFPVVPGKNPELEFAALSPLSGGKLILKVSAGGRDIVKREYLFSPLRQKYRPKDARLDRWNIGYRKAMDDTGWSEVSVPLGPLPGGEAILRFSFEGEGAAFLANPRLFRQSPVRRPNVIYIIFDGVGTRFWSFYNPDSGLTPFMKDAAEKDFTVFDNMFTLGDKTRISTSGLFTSVLPFKTGHGINRNYIPERNKEQFYASVRSGEIASLPDVFRRRGYVTEQFGNSGFTVHLLTTGIDYGFSRSYEFSVNPYNNFGISRSFFEFLRKNRDREFFTYIHYNTTHKPYYMPAGHFLKGILNAPAGALWRPAYVGCVSYADDVFRNIYAALKEQGLLENTIIVVATDHGSGFDFGKYNLGNQYNDYTRMTFMMHLPEKRKREALPGRKRIGTFLSSINTAPTLLELAGLPAEKAFSGRSFSSMFRDGPEKSFFDREIWSFGRKTASLIVEDMHKYIIRHTDSENQIEKKYIFFGEQEEVLPEELYDLKADPLENRNLFTARRDLLRSFRLKYLALDIHHPERTALTFVPADGKARRIEIVIDTPTEITGADLYSPDLKVFSKNLRKERDGGRYRFSFAVGKDPLHLIFDLKNDRAPLIIKILEDGRPVPRGKILATDLNISLFENPVLLKEKNDFLLLNGISLPDTAEIIKGRAGLTVKVSRIDLHRWIDIGRLESRGISAGMKETLKSWGYIQ